MIKELSDTPPGVIGFEASGKLTAKDYRDVVLPALEEAAATGEVRFVIVIDDFGGMTGGALWQISRSALNTFERGSALRW
jgi:hypothetical protein